MSLLPRRGSLRDDYSEYDGVSLTLIRSVHIYIDSTLTVCVCVLGCSLKGRARTSVQSLVWCLKRRSGSCCATRSCPGPSSGPSCGTPGNLLDPSSTWTRSIRRRLSSRPFSSLTPSAWPVRTRAVTLLHVSCVRYTIHNYGLRLLW